jgi:hypothetical protein
VDEDSPPLQHLQLRVLCEHDVLDDYVYSPLGLSTPSISGIAYTWNPYPNGNTSEIVQLCYKRPNAANDLGCAYVTDARSGNVSTFNNESAKGTVTLRHTLTGGTYAATPSGVSDTVTVNYVY